VSALVIAGPDPDTEMVRLTDGAPFQLALPLWLAMMVTGDEFVIVS
jgi:hypothetical protein